MADLKARLTSEEREATQRALRESRDELHALCTGLSGHDWECRDGAGRWSVAEIVEHLALVEHRLGKRMQAMLAAPAEPCWRELTAGQDAVVAASAVPDQKIQSPPAGEPSGERPPGEALADFDRAREATLSLAADPSLPLKEHVFAHRALGPLNAHQWLLLAANHTRRHMVQMRRALAARERE